MFEFMIYNTINVKSYQNSLYFTYNQTNIQGRFITVELLLYLWNKKDMSFSYLTLTV